MGWWRSGRNPNDVLGDGPADVLEEALGRLARSADTKPTFQALLNHLAAVLRRDANDWLADPVAYRGQPLVVHFEPPAPDLVSAPAAENPHMLAALAAAMKGIAGEYELEQSRKPTLSEVLGTIAFVLRVDADRYVSDAKGRTLVALATASDPA